MKPPGPAGDSAGYAGARSAMAGRNAMMEMRILALVAVLTCAAGPAAAQTGQLEVTNAWARATPGKSTIGAAYVMIQSPTADRLVAASTPVAKKAELHTMSMSGMIMQMRPLAGIDIPAGEPVTMKPGATHVMLIGLAKPLKASQTLPMTLGVAMAGTRTVDGAVEKIGAMGPASATQH
jgi:periplasmic copper chaperone A